MQFLKTECVRMLCSRPGRFLLAPGNWLVAALAVFGHHMIHESLPPQTRLDNLEVLAIAFLGTAPVAILLNRFVRRWLDRLATRHLDIYL